jgi:hypothetical protein
LSSLLEKFFYSNIFRSETLEKKLLVWYSIPHTDMPL